jgi:hypothetical protein
MVVFRRRKFTKKPFVKNIIRAVICKYLKKKIAFGCNAYIIGVKEY